MWDIILNHIEGLSELFKYEVQQVDDLVSEGVLFADGGGDGAWTVVAKYRLGEQHVVGVKQQCLRLTGCIIMGVGENRMS